MSFVIFDTEYTSWKGCLENGWHGHQKKEIVQIAALKISEHLSVTASFEMLCKPVVNPVLSDYFTDLTHITNAQIAKYGRPFGEVYEAFEDFAEDSICYSHGWNAGWFDKSDGEIIQENLKLYGLSAKKDLVYRNIAPVFKTLYEENKIKVISQSSGQIAPILGLTEKMKNLHLAPHNALYDVHSILEGLKYFYPHSTELMRIFEQGSASLCSTGESR